MRRAPHAEALPLALSQLARGTSVDVIASNDLAVHWLQTPPSSVNSLNELRLVAAARCAHLFGGTPSDWWVAADWNATAPFVCGALPCSTVMPLRNKLAAAGVDARWHTAWGVACGSKSNTFPPDGWSALRSPNRVVLWHCSKGRIDFQGTLGVLRGTTDGDAKAKALGQIRIEAMRDSALSSTPLHWVSLAAADRGEPCEATAALGLSLHLADAAS